MIPILRVMDIELSLAFYTRVLGFEGGGLPSDDGCLAYAEASLGESRLAFIRSEGCNRFAANPCGIDLYITLPETMRLEGLHRRLAERGQVVSDLRDGLWGDRAFSLVDLDGNRLVFAQAVRYDRAEVADTQPMKAAVAKTA